MQTGRTTGDTSAGDAVYQLVTLTSPAARQSGYKGGSGICNFTNGDGDSFTSGGVL